MVTVRGTSCIFAGVIAVVSAGQTAAAQVNGQTTLRCTCSDGRNLEAGVVSYYPNSDRETITRIEAEPVGSAARCKAIWIGMTEVRPVGNPYDFHLERTALKEKRIFGCDYPTEGFAKRTKTYNFKFNADSFSIREMPARESDDLQVNGKERSAESNSNLWSSIAEVPSEIGGNRKSTAQIDPTREFNRTSWIVARGEIKGHYVGVVKDAYQGERLITLKKTRIVKAGQIGQIEAVGAGRAIVRFYEGGTTHKFAHSRSSFRRWYDRIGGPYAETKDDLFTPFQACILEVSLDDIVEVNDYLDQKQSDRT
jgi:hypothetical protein